MHRKPLLSPRNRRDYRRRFLLVGVLMLHEVEGLDVALALGLIAHDESRRRQRSQACININVVVREYRGLEPLRAILKTAFPVCLAPQTLEEDPVLKGQIGKVFVLEESRLDVARTAHVRLPADRRW